MRAREVATAALTLTLPLTLTLALILTLTLSLTLTLPLTLAPTPALPRCEYSVMGPSVNLAARLMCSCEAKGVELLCNDALHDEARIARALTPSLTPTLPLAPAAHPRQVSRQGHAHFSFTAFEPLKVKGYSEPVAFYHPRQSGHVAKARCTPGMLHPLPPLACYNPLHVQGSELLTSPLHSRLASCLPPLSTGA